VIFAASRLLARSLLEVAIALIVLGGLVGYLAFRVLRRLVTDHPDRLEELAGRAGVILSLVAAAAARRTRT
jgi:hypothetical protein